MTEDQMSSEVSDEIVEAVAGKLNDMWRSGEDPKTRDIVRVVIAEFQAEMMKRAN